MAQLFMVYIGVPINGGTPTWMGYKGKYIYEWMIEGYPYFRKPLYLNLMGDVIGVQRI